jgi:hypothetical protein
VVPNPTLHFTTQTIKGLKIPIAGRVEYFDEAMPGLCLRITSKGVRTWTLFYRVLRRS